MPDYSNPSDEPVTVTLCDITVETAVDGSTVIRAIPQIPITIPPNTTCQLTQVVDGNVLVLIPDKATP